MFDIPSAQAAGRYLAVALGLCLGLMAKPMVVTLPFVLLLLDYWPLARLRQRGRKALWEKLPLLGLSGAAAAITYLVQEHAGAVKAVPLQRVWPTRRFPTLSISSKHSGRRGWRFSIRIRASFAFLPLLAAGASVGRRHYRRDRAAPPLRRTC